MIHGISHGLGLAVHDPAQFSYGDRVYKPGDVFTIEPGIYVSARMLDALPDTPKNRAFIAKVKPIVAKYENTGVRIEDDYVITETGLERISTAPREIAEIEALMKKRQRSGAVMRASQIAALRWSRATCIDRDSGASTSDDALVYATFATTSSKVLSAARSLAGSTRGRGLCSLCSARRHDVHFHGISPDVDRRDCGHRRVTPTTAASRRRSMRRRALRRSRLMLSTRDGRVQDGSR